MISWQANIDRGGPSEDICWEFPCSSMGRRLKQVCFCFVLFFEGEDNDTFPAQFPLKAAISHLRKTFQSPLSTVLLIDLFSGCQVLTLSWHVCSPLFIPPCPCECSAVSSHLERHQSDSPIPSKRPSSRSETSESPLSSKRPRTAEKSAGEQVGITQTQTSDAFRCS